MAATAYRAARGNTGMIILLVILMQAGILAMVPVAGPGPMDSTKLWLFAIPPACALVIGLTIAFSRHRRRMTGLQKELTALGFQAEMKPSQDPKATMSTLWNLIQPLSSSLWIQGGPKNIRWLAVPRDDAAANAEARCWLFEFEYVTGSGKATQVHHRTIALWPANYPGLPATALGREPGFWMGRHGWLQRRASRKASLPPETLGGLGRIWTLQGSTATGERFVTPATRASLQQSPKGECWSLGGGWTACFFKNRLDGPNLRLFYQRARKLLSDPR